VAATTTPRLHATLRESESVTPLELFFDLVFVLAFTQCTALMADEPTWEGLAKGLLVLGVMWWAWVGYAWLTSVVDPEEGAVRIAIFAAMAALLVVALSIPQAFGDLGLLLAIAYGGVRGGQIALFVIASRDDPELRHSVVGLAISTAIGTGLLVAASFADHGLGAEAGVDAGVVAAAVLGIVIAAMLWWMYFDIVALVSERRLLKAPEGLERNRMARDSFSYLHFPMIAGIILLALGLKKTLEHVDDPLKLVPAFALLGGVAIYSLAHVAYRWRNVHTFNSRRFGFALLMLALLPVAVEIPALATVAGVAVLLVGLVAYETRSYGEARARLRHEVARH
jgi:low temperature requirement protein LtrA